MNKEVWKPIPGYTKYEVSNLGRILSRARPIAPRILKPVINKDGYGYVVLSRDKTRHKMGVHQLVALAFLGTPPDKSEVCHKDGNPHNNHLDNLKYGSRSDNVKDAQRHGTYVPPPVHTEENHHCAKLTKNQVRRIRRLYKAGAYTLVELGKMFGVHHTNISLIVKRKTWQNV